MFFFFFLSNEIFQIINLYLRTWEILAESLVWELWINKSYEKWVPYISRLKYLDFQMFSNIYLYSMLNSIYEMWFVERTILTDSVTIFLSDSYTQNRIHRIPCLHPELESLLFQLSMLNNLKIISGTVIQQAIYGALRSDGSKKYNTRSKARWAEELEWMMLCGKEKDEFLCLPTFSGMQRSVRSSNSYFRILLVPHLFHLSLAPLCASVITRRSMPRKECAWWV